MSIQYGSYGFICEDGLDPAPLVLYDFGIERRQNEPYFYNNRARANYDGYLFQYTMDGIGYFETESGRQHSVSSIEKGHEWIGSHFNEPFSIAELCDKLQVSPPHFSRQFRARYGVTPLSHINRLRLEYALSLLLNSSLPVQEIAIKSGFSDGNYFAKVFRKYLGMSPTEYRDSRL